MSKKWWTSLSSSLHPFWGQPAYNIIQKQLLTASNILLKFVPPVRHLQLPAVHVLPSLTIRLRLHLADVPGAVEQRHRHGPPVALLVRGDEEFGEVTSPGDEVCIYSIWSSFEIFEY